MANAVITTTQISNPTLTQLADFWSNAMVTAGFTQIGTSTGDGNDQLRYLEYQYRTGVTYNKFCAEIGIFNNGLATHFSRFRSGSDITGGNTLNNIGVTAQQASQDNNGNAWLTGTFIAYSIAHPELRGTLLYKGTTFQNEALFFRPATLPSWVNENVYPFAFVNSTATTAHSYATQSSLRPAGTSNSMLLNCGNAVGVSPNSSDSNNRLIITNSVISNNNGTNNQNGVCQLVLMSLLYPLMD
jgi:hypothetical protein